jgi:hypothetical protein
MSKKHIDVDYEDTVKDTSANVPAVQSAPNALVVGGLADDDHDYLMGQKTDDFGAGDMVVPWLTLVQGTSGYVKRNDPNYNPEAREGDITDNLTKRLRASQSVILCRYEVHYTTWRPNGGKIVAQHYQDPTAYNAAKFPINKKTGKPNNFGKKIDADGNEVKPTAVYYVLAVDRKTGVFTPMVWGLGSTQFSKSKKINSLAREMMMSPKGPYIPPIYARIFDLTTCGEQGEVDGQMKYWSGWVANPGEAVLARDAEGNYVNPYGKMWLTAAVEFRDAVMKGQVRPALPEETAEATPSDDDDRGDERDHQGGRYAQKVPAVADDDIPF